MPNNSKNWKELPPIEDKIQQVFLFLENMKYGLSEFGGKWRFEVGEADDLYSILKTAFEQILSSERGRIITLMESLRREYGQTEQCSDVLKMNHLIGRNEGWNTALDTIITKIQEL